VPQLVAHEVLFTTASLAVVPAQRRHRPRLSRGVRVLDDSSVKHLEVALQPVVAELDPLAGGSALRGLGDHRLDTLELGGDAGQLLSLGFVIGTRAGGCADE
jgi:hypothetical protein